MENIITYSYGPTVVVIKGTSCGAGSKWDYSEILVSSFEYEKNFNKKYFIYYKYYTSNQKLK